MKTKRKFKCCRCGKLGHWKLQEIPYDAEINDDHSKHRICESCATQSAEDI